MVCQMRTVKDTISLVELHNDRVEPIVVFCASGGDD